MIKLKITKNLGVTLIVCMLLVTSVFANTLTVSGDVTATFGNTHIGNSSVHFSTNKDASRFRLIENGEVQSITAFFGSYWFFAKAAIYSDNNGTPGSLITQSENQRVYPRGWYTFTVPKTSLTPGYYWLSVVTSSSRAWGRADVGSSGQHCFKTTTLYSAEFTDSFGTPKKYDIASPSIYATYIPEPPATQNPLPAQSLVQNGDFETGIAPWEIGVSDSSYVGTLTTNSDAYAGSHSGQFRVTQYPKNSNGWITALQSFPAETGKNYTLEFYYKGTMTVVPHVFCFSSTWQNIALFSGPTCPPTSDWKQVKMNLGPIPQGTNITQIH